MLKVVAVTSSGNDGNIEGNVLDGNLATRWSCLGAGSWIQFDLGGVMSIGEVDVAWYKGDTGRISQFQVTISNDNLSFQPVFTGKSSGTTTQLEKYPLTGDQVARYVRITVNGNSQNQWASITEVEIQGPVSPPPPPPTGVRVQTRQTTTPGNPVPDNLWTVTADTNPNGLPTTIHPMVVQNESFNTQENTPLGIVLSVTNNQGAVTWTESTPANGVLSPASPPPPVAANMIALTYAPNQNFIGQDLFTYSVSDNQGNTSNVATVTISVTNLSPVDTVTASDISASTSENTSVIIDPKFSLSDANAEIASISISSPANGDATQSNGVFTYTPNTGFSGSDSFTYTGTDNSTPPVISNRATVTIEVSGTASNVDKFGMQKIYDDAPGPVTYIDMTNPENTFGANPGNNPEGNTQYYPKFTQNQDGSWRNNNGKEVRWAWCAEGNYPGDSNICKCYDTDNKTHNMGNAGDWRPAIEMSGYFRSAPGSTTTSTTNGECHFELVISGHRSTTSSTASGPGGCDLGCAGSYHLNFYPLTGRQKTEKDYHHSFAYAKDITGVNNNTATPKWAGDNLWHGFKGIFYILPDGQTVQLELWTDWNADNNWKKTHSFQDDGIKWVPKAAYTGCGNGPQTIQFLFNGPLVDFRADNWNFYDLKNLSVRTIDPTKPLQAREEHEKMFPIDSTVVKEDEIYQTRGGEIPDIIPILEAKEHADEIAENAKSPSIRKQAESVSNKADQILTTVIVSENLNLSKEDVKVKSTPKKKE